MWHTLWVTIHTVRHGTVCVTGYSIVASIIVVKIFWSNFVSLQFTYFKNRLYLGDGSDLSGTVSATLIIIYSNVYPGARAQDFSKGRRSLAQGFWSRLSFIFHSGFRKIPAPAEGGGGGTPPAHSNAYTGFYRTSVELLEKGAISWGCGSFGPTYNRNLESVWLPLAAPVLDKIIFNRAVEYQ